METGISLYPDFTDTSEMEAYVYNAATLGYRHVFLSFILEELHFAGAAGPESAVFDHAIACCRAHGLRVVGDVNPEVINGFGTPAGAVAALARRGLSCLRADSVLHDDVLDGLADAGMEMEFNAADFALATPVACAWAAEEMERLLAHLRAEQISGCFNFYPRTGTGLSLARVRETTAFLHGYGLKTAAFVSSLTARPVLHAQGRGVPTAECLRDTPPELAARVLDCCGVDRVLFGDVSASDAELRALARACGNEVIDLPVVYCRDCPEEVRSHLAACVVANREDAPEYVLRCTATRGLVVEPARTGPRSRYSVTVDNSRSAQYRGEVQIMLRDMPACAEANVIGFIHPDAHILLPFLTESQVHFRMVPYPGT